MEIDQVKCRFCERPLKTTFVDLGVQPLCETYVPKDQLNQMEPSYPLHVYLCENCFLVQLEASITPKEIYKNYAYFSSSSKNWLIHCENYANMITEKIGLNQDMQVIEIASNDGYLLQFFAQHNIPVLGIEPATNVAEEANAKGIPTVKEFFNSNLAEDLVKQNKQADLLIANNIIAQVPDLNDFIKGLKILLKPTGILTIEFHYLKNLIEKSQFDTISHERFSYFSFFVIQKVLADHGLAIFDAEGVPTHGGSLRIYACHTENTQIKRSKHVDEILMNEKTASLMEIDTYLSFREKVKATKWTLLDILIKAKRNGKSIIGYGAHAEAHTLLNYCGIRTDFLDYLVDRNPKKQGKFLAGVLLPIYGSDKILETQPDYVLVLPWSIKSEIMNQISYIGNWGGRFIVPIPKLEVYDAKGNEITGNLTRECV